MISNVCLFVLTLKKERENILEEVIRLKDIAETMNLEKSAFLNL
jgi:hypothetical protein